MPTARHRHTPAPSARHEHAPEATARHIHTPRAFRSGGDDSSADGFLRSAGEAATRGDWRACADNYLAAYRSCREAWPLRYNCWSGFTSVLREGNLPLAPGDWAALWSVAEDSEAPALDRVQSLFTIGFVSNMHQDASTSRRGYEEAMRLADEVDVRTRPIDTPPPTNAHGHARPHPCRLVSRVSSQEASREAQVTVATDSGYAPLPVGQIVDELRQFALDNARLLPTTSDSPPSRRSDSRMAFGVGGGGGVYMRHQHSPAGGGAVFVPHEHSPSLGGGAALQGGEEDAFGQPVVLTSSLPSLVLGQGTGTMIGTIPATILLLACSMSMFVFAFFRVKRVR